MEQSEKFATLEEALHTNLILFDYGRVLGTQIEDVFDQTTERVLHHSGIGQGSLKTQGRWNSFEEGLRRLIIPPGLISEMVDDRPAGSGTLRNVPEGVQVISRLDLHRHRSLFQQWIGNINAYLGVYGAVRSVTPAQFEEAYFGPLRPNPWIQEKLRELLHLKARLNLRFGVISNFEAAGKPWMLRLLRQHYAGLVDDDLVVITGEEGVVKGDGPEAFAMALQRFRRSYGEPVSPIFVDDQVDRYLSNAGRAGIRAFVHYGFAGADSKDKGGFYGSEFEIASLYPSAGNNVPLFKALFEKSDRSD
jgi:hypothetical protein